MSCMQHKGKYQKIQLRRSVSVDLTSLTLMNGMVCIVKASNTLTAIRRM